MNDAVRQQIIISGVGGQGVLFVTRLLAEAAINKGIPVFTSETHGMAQRGGTVISYLKAGNFTSPLIRPGRADGILSLKAENMAQHGAFLKPGGWAVVNGQEIGAEDSSFFIDADALAKEINNPKSVNLIMLGFALKSVPDLFCSFEDVRQVIQARLKAKPMMMEAALSALEAGCSGR